MGSQTKVTADELARHAQEHDGWMALNGVVWDFSGFMKKHPGGEEIIGVHLGKDGSEVYNEIHSPALVQRHLGPSKRVGTVDGAGSASTSQRETVAPKPPSSSLPPLDSIVSLAQFETVAARELKDKTWLYIAGATEDGYTAEANREYFRRIMFRPRVLRGVGVVDTTTSILGHKLSCPILIAPTSSVKLTHPDGELALARASEACGVPTVIPSMGSYSVSEIAEAMTPKHPFFCQLYVDRDRGETERMLSEFRRLDAKGIMVTVDLPVLSKRETSTRRLNQDQQKHSAQNERQLAPPPASTRIDPDLSWDDIRWIMERSGLPVFLKGIQCAEDAKRAWEIGCAGIYLSNHGGRALDTSTPALLTLLEIHRLCPEILQDMEVIVDGGIRRGTDVLKAVCLGARAVCIGRSFLYALVYGETGVKRAFEILKEELKIAMQLLGITRLEQAHRRYLNTAELDMLINSSLHSDEMQTFRRRTVRL